MGSSEDELSQAKSEKERERAPSNGAMREPQRSGNASIAEAALIDCD